MYQFHLETNTQRKLVGEMEWKTQGLREKRRQRGWRRNGVGMRGVFFYDWGMFKGRSRGWGRSKGTVNTCMWCAKSAIQ